MYRTSGLIVLSLGLLLTYSLALTTFNRPAERWRFNEAGGLDQMSVECPMPVAILFGDAQHELEYAADVPLCVRSARTLFVEAVIVLVLALGLGGWGIVRGSRPAPQPIRSLRSRTTPTSEP